MSTTQEDELLERIADAITYHPGYRFGTPEQRHAVARELARTVLKSLRQELTAFTMPKEEHGHLMSGGGVHVWPDDPEVLEIYPLAKRIEHTQRHGTVLRRRIVELDDWEEIT